MLYRGTKLVISSVLIAGIAGLTFSAVTQSSNSGPKPDAYNSISIPSAANGILSQCGSTYLFDIDPNWFGTIPEDYDGDVPRHPMIVPVYGYMSAAPFDEAKIDTIARDKNPYTYAEVIRGLWEGNHVVWVAPEYEQEGWDFIVKYADSWNAFHEDKIVVLPWNMKQTIPMNRQIAFSNWGASQTCQTFSEETFSDFIDNTSDHASGRDKKNPPVAVLNSNKSLNIIAPN